MTTVIIAVVVLAVLGAIFGLVLAIASKVFAVEVDPREEAILGCLPGANCGGCGYPGCSGYASAVVKGVAPVNACAAGGEAVAAQIGEIMGVSAGAAVKQIAQVHCTGCGQNYKQYTYVGIHDCVAASKLPGGGDLGCAYGCLGLGSCEKACPFDAIHVIDGVARVDEEKCKACNKCVDICPRHIIALEPYKTKRHVTIPCSSHDKGVDARKVCDNGCIGCSLCAKSCPKEAITMVNNLAVIDYEKCIGCGICAQKCPRKLITVDGKVVGTLDLSRDTELTVTGANKGTNHLIVRDGEIWCSEASCPDKVCVHQGKKHLSSDTIVCLPNKMIVTITGDE